LDHKFWQIFLLSKNSKLRGLLVIIILFLGITLFVLGSLEKIPTMIGSLVLGLSLLFSFGLWYLCCIKEFKKVLIFDFKNGRNHIIYEYWKTELVKTFDKSCFYTKAKSLINIPVLIKTDKGFIPFNPFTLQFSGFSPHELRYWLGNDEIKSLLHVEKKTTLKEAIQWMMILAILGGGAFLIIVLIDEVKKFYA